MAFWCSTGAFAEYQKVNPTQIAMFRVPENVTVKQAPILELVIASCRALMNHPAAPNRESITICGLGPSGLVLCQYAKALGYRRVVGWDLYQSRRDLALRLGADEVYNPAELTVEQIARMRPTDVGVLMMGDDILPGEPTATLLMRAVRIGGTVISYGHPEHGMRFSPFVFQSRNLTMTGPENNMDTIRRKGAAVMELVRNGGIQIQPLITHCHPFEQLGEAFGQPAFQTGGSD